MKDLEIIEHYNSLDQFAKDKIDRELIDLVHAKKESRNYCIKVCLKWGSANSRFTKGGKTIVVNQCFNVAVVINALLLIMVSLHIIPIRMNLNGIC